MKKMLIVAALLLIACDKEDEKCNCNGIYVSSEDPEYMVTMNTEIDCGSKMPTHTVYPPIYFAGCE